MEGMSFIKQQTAKMRSLVKENLHNLENDIFISDFAALAKSINYVLEYPVYSLAKNDLQKHIIYYSQQLKGKTYGY